jgi:hypothetical protein
VTGGVASGELYCDFRPPDEVNGGPALIVLGHRGVVNDRVVLEIGEAGLAQHSLLPVALLAAARWEAETHEKEKASTA